MIEVEYTPNPCALKFMLKIKVSPENPRMFSCIEECYDSHLARKLLSIDDVNIVFFGDDFITVTKEAFADWKVLQPQIIVTILDHIEAGFGIYNLDSEEGKMSQKISSFDNKCEDSVDEHIRQVLDDYIKPAIAMDGGGLVYHGFKDGVVTLTLIGACKGCPQSEITLKHGIETTLKYHVPEVISIKTIKDKKANTKTKRNRN